MKVRLDYVSNSSSSSFMVLGSKYTPNDGWRLTIEDFDNLEDGEMFFAVFPDICDGDYVFKITPELMMDFDLREKPIAIDTYADNVTIWKMRKYRSDDYATEFTYDASDWGERTYNRGEEVQLEDIPRRKGEHISCWVVDDHSPTHPKDIINWLERRHG